VLQKKKVRVVNPLNKNFCIGERDEVYADDV